MTERKARIWNKAYTCAFIANFLLCMSQNIVNTMIAEYAKGPLHASAAIVGAISGIYFGVAFAVRPFSGPAITKLNKKYVMIVSYMLGVVVNVAYAFAATVGWFVLARVLHGLQFAFIGSLNLTLASDSLPKEKMGSGLGLFGVGGAIATAIGPSIGVWLCSWGDRAFGADKGYAVVFLVSAACMLVSLVPCLLMPDQKPTREALDRLGAWYKNIVAKEAIIPTVAMTFVCMASMLYTTFMRSFAKEIGISDERISLFFTMYAVFLLVARPFCGRLVDRFGTQKVFIPSVVIYAASFLVVGLSRSLGPILFGAALAAIGYGSAQPSLQTLCMSSVPKERSGVASNTNYFGMDFGYFIGPTLGSLVASRSDYSTMFVAALVPLALSVVVFLFGYGRQKSRT